MKIITPDEFVARPWKNGKGQTLELAINEGGSIESFDWRVSIAQVVENGLFSDFGGYDRWLFLIDGEGIELVHDDVTRHSLTRSLDVASFDGGSKTSAILHGGPITDFNLMTRQGMYRVLTTSSPEAGRVVPGSFGVCLIYSPRNSLQLRDTEHRVRKELPAGHLLVAEDDDGAGYRVDGEEMIVIELTRCGTEPV